MEHTIKVNDDKKSAEVNGRKLEVSQCITYKETISHKIVKGIIITFAIVDKKDLKSAWVYMGELKTGLKDWVCLNRWADLFASEHKAPEAPEVVQVDKTKKNRSTKATATVTAPVILEIAPINNETFEANDCI